jgi:DNA-binding CsgD family transcriptional regulator
MLVEQLTFLATFIATAGITAIGILVAYHLFRQDKRDVFQILLYQQIFLFSFYMYSIWGNLALRQILTDVNLSSRLEEKLALFVPVLGIPFLTISWLMLMKFSFSLKKKSFSKRWILFYVILLIVSFFTAVFVWDEKISHTNLTPDIYLIKCFATANLLFHFLFLYPYWKNIFKKATVPDQKAILNCMLLYTAATAVSSVLLWNSSLLGIYSMSFSFLFLFGVGAFLPVCLKLTQAAPNEKEEPPIKNFDTFCAEFGISKREAEIILEICSGKTNKAIADKLFITLQTVKDHTHRIYSKTDVKSRVQLANLVNEKTGQEKSS